MIHSEPEIAATCDQCGATATYTPNYSHYTVPDERYTYTVKDIEKQLRDDGWIIVDGKHFCYPGCYRKWQEAHG